MGEPRLNFLRPYQVTADAFDPRWVDKLKTEILDNPLLSSSTLNTRFSGTLGFSIAFRRPGLAQMKKHFPEFMPYLERVLHPKGNAFFLNPLVIYRGNRVAPHIDRSLKSWTAPDIPPFPLKVSVLYVSVPEPFEGGQLVLYRYRPILKLDPKTNVLFQFQGKLRHEVGEVLQAGSDPERPEPRISLVCEHYRLPADLLERVPDFYAKTKRPFEEFLESALGDEESLDEPCDLEASDTG